MGERPRGGVVLGGIPSLFSFWAHDRGVIGEGLVLRAGQGWTLVQLLGLIPHRRGPGVFFPGAGAGGPAAGRGAGPGRGRGQGAA